MLQTIKQQKGMNKMGFVKKFICKVFNLVDEKELTKLSNQLEEVKRNNKNLTDTLSLKNIEILRLNEVLSDTQKTVNDQKLELKTKSEVITELQRQIKELQESSGCEEALKELQAARETIKQQEDEIQALKKQIEDLLGQSEKVQLFVETEPEIDLFVDTQKVESGTVLKRAKGDCVINAVAKDPSKQDDVQLKVEDWKVGE